MKTNISPETARSLSHMIQVSGSAAAAAHDIRIGLEAIRPYTDRRSERLLGLLVRMAEQEARNPEAYARNLAFVKQHAMLTEVA